MSSRTAFVAICMSALSLAAVVCAGGQQDFGSDIAITNLPQAGAIEIANHGPSVDIKTKLLVQREYKGEWRDETTDTRIIEKCGDSPGVCRRLAHNAVLRPVPWNGLICASQCSAGCRANLYLGPGKFRFVVESCDGKSRTFGPPFEMPGPPSR